MKKELDIGLLYLSLHNLLRKKIGVDRIISRKEFYCILGKHFLVPKEIRVVIIKEMEQRKLIVQENKNDIRILDCDLKIEEDISKFYQEVGLF